MIELRNKQGQLVRISGSETIVSVDGEEMSLQEAIDNGKIGQTLTVVQVLSDSTEDVPSAAAVKGAVNAVAASVASLAENTAKLATEVDGLGKEVQEVSDTVDSLSEEVANKQNKLKAGDNITIDPDGTISATGGGGGGSVTIDKTIPAAPSDSHVPSTKLLNTELEKKQIKLKAGDNITINPDGTISASLAGGTTQVASEVSYTNADGSQTNVQAKLTELDGKTKGDKYDVTLDAPQVNFKTDNDEYIGHVDDDGIHAKEFYIKKSSGEEVKVSELANQSGTDIFSLNGGEKHIELMLQQLKYGARTETSYSYENSNKLFTFLHFSDIHADVANIKRIVQFLDKFDQYIDIAICSGDIVASNYDQPFNFWMDNVDRDDILLTIGNHEGQIYSGSPHEGSPELVDATGHPGKEVPPSWCYAKYLAPYIDRWGATYQEGKTYYYKDISGYEETIRLIILDSNVYLEEQNNWLKDVLSDANTKKYSVIISQHHPVVGRNSYDSGSTERFDHVYDNFSSSFLSSSMPKGLKAQNDNYPYAVDAVSDFIDKGGKFVCWITGHVHTDDIGRVGRDPRQIDINISCASHRNLSRESITPEGTILQDCLNLIAIDPTFGHIKVLRIGRNLSRGLQARNAILIDYKNRKVLSFN